MKGKSQSLQNRYFHICWPFDLFFFNLTAYKLQIHLLYLPATLLKIGLRTLMMTWPKSRWIVIKGWRTFWVLTSSSQLRPLKMSHFLIDTCPCFSLKSIYSVSHVSGIPLVTLILPKVATWLRWWFANTSCQSSLFPSWPILRRYLSSKC